MQDTITNKPSIFSVVPAIAYEGISKQVLLQMQALHELGYPVKLIVLTTVDDIALAEFAPGIARSKITELRQPDAYLAVQALKSAYGASRKIKQLLWEEKNAVVFAHAPYAHFLLRLAMLQGLHKNRGIKLWQYFHITQYLEFPLVSLRRKLLNNLNIWLAKRFDDGHVFVSEAVKADIQQHLVRLSKSIVIYNALPSQSNPTKYNATLKTVSAKFKILLPGRVEASKGQLWFLEPFREFVRLNELSPNQVELVIAGTGGQFAEIEKAVVRKGLQDYVQLPGKLTNEELTKRMQQSSLVVVPSFIEGLPLVVLEALQQHSLVLASDIQSNQEVICNTKVGMLFKAGNKADCIAKLQHVYKHKSDNLIHDKSIDALLTTKFSFERHIQEIITLIEKG